VQVYVCLVTLPRQKLKILSFDQVNIVTRK